MLIKVAVADTNSEYLSRFVSALENNPAVEVLTYTDRSILRYDVEKRKMDVLLFDPSVYSGDYEISDRIVSVMLFDDSTELLPIYSRFEKIKKYQQVSVTFKMLLDLYSSHIGNQGRILGDARTAILAVYSPLGGSGCTSIALALAEHLSAQGNRTLFISFEDFASESIYLSQNGKHGMSDLLAFLGENVDMKMKLQAFVQNRSENFFYLQHFDTPKDLYTLSEEDIRELLERIDETGLFDSVIVDLPSSVCVQTQAVFAQADHIFVVEKTDELSSIKMQAFFNQKYVVDSYISKMHRIINFSTGRSSKLQSPIIVAVIKAMQGPDPSMMVRYIADNYIGEMINRLI